MTGHLPNGPRDASVEEGSHHALVASAEVAPALLAAAGLLDVLVTQVARRSLRSTDTAQKSAGTVGDAALDPQLPQFRTLAEDLWLPPGPPADAQFIADFPTTFTDGVSDDQSPPRNDEDRRRAQITACLVAGAVFIALRAGGQLDFRTPMADVFVLGLLPMTWVGAGLIYDRRVSP